MDNYVLGFGDIGTEATFSGGVWQSGLDTTMLSRLLLTAAARTIDLSELMLDITLSSSIPVQVLGIVNHNLSPNGTYQWQCFANSDRDILIYDSGIISVHEYDASLPIKTTCDAFTPSTDSPYWRLTVNDSNTFGYIQIGRLFMGKRFNSGVNMTYGMTMGIDTSDSVIESSTVGLEAYVQSVRKRTANFSHLLMDYAVGNNAYKLGLQEGVTKMCLFELDPANKQEGIFTFAGRHESVDPLSFPNFNINNFSFSIKEIY